MDEQKEEYQTDGHSTIKVTDNILYMAKRFPMWGGMQSMYMTIYIILGSFYLFSITGLISIEPDKVTGTTFDLLYILLALFLPPLFLWRMDLPLCFNRKTQMVTTYQEGQLCQVKWHKGLMYDHKFGPNAYGQYIYVHAIDIVRENKSVVGGLSEDIRICVERQCAMLIEDYMDGKEIVLDKESQFLVDKYNFQLSIKELFVSRFITPFKNRHTLEWFFAIAFYELPMAIFIFFPTDMILYVLNKILPRRRIPKVLKEACGMSDDEKVFG